VAEKYEPCASLQSGGLSVGRGGSGGQLCVAATEAARVEEAAVAVAEPA